MSQKLVIRVKNAESLADASAKPPQTVTVYHWNRIIAAGCVAFALFAGALWGVYRWAFTSPADVSQTDFVAQNEPSVITDERPEQAAESTSVSLAAEDKREEWVSGRAESTIDEPVIADATPEIPAEPVVAPDPVAPESTLEESVVIAEPAATLAEEAPPEVETVEEVEVAQDMEDMQEDPVDPTKRRHLETVSSGGEPVKIFSDAISRAQLTQELDDSEPTNALRDSIVMNDEGLLRIYLFTEMMDMTGQTLYHEWYRDDKRVARIRIRPHRSPMRASSSKFIDRHMLGQWTVKVTGPEGNVLAEAAFSVN
ncbi:DUF2914 domain-containing protein [Hahella aquimaris]|uniref:DUF2914 domain-containing protein n=1 Tax=Hahella sp. HNIBRBA332 TaxID=3015983 RepID=UPI00273B39EA|nr:DUF2914 domain-containing protein [Hahella sp. HNIBRBA332]WLQ15744.1 DUF2914 domain-containing protein [Hahella sp. HNIBRBA332]